MARKFFRRAFLVPALAVLTLGTVVPFAQVTHADNPSSSYGVNMWGTPHCNSSGGYFIVAPEPQDSVCVDQQVYNVGDTVTICYDVAYGGELVDVSLQGPSGTFDLAYGYDDGTGNCFQGDASMPGWRTVTLSDFSAFEIPGRNPTSISYYVQ